MTNVHQFIFFDFEMLCSSNGMPFSAMESIRLGAVKYDIETQTIKQFDRFIKPKYHKPLSQFCKELTKIEDCDLADAKHFPGVFQEFILWVGDISKSRFFSWSSSDLNRFELDALSHDIPINLVNEIKCRYVDFQAVFSKRVSKTNHSVENALALYQLPFVGEKHNPMYDAYNTLQIYLAFSNDLLKSDYIMLKQFIFGDQIINPLVDINIEIKKHLKKDLSSLFSELPIITNIRHGKRILKRTSKLAKKYENILINRSGMFNQENIYYVQKLIEFYRDLVNSYEEHYHYGCKVFILHEHMTLPLKQMSA
jgi:inhibitor of KinA sporulation pathway (predicted exonuclease)